MHVKFASNLATAFAAVLLLAACTSKPETAADTSGTGQASGTQVAVAAAPAPGSQEDLVVNVGDRVFFDFDRYELKPDARAQLEKQAAWLRNYPQVTVTVEGHADERGTREYNLALGERRADAARNYLIALGIDANRIQIISYGKERPAVVGSDETAWSQNRRAVTVVN
ncbi:MAG TPA: peptidoglycan-associated lipoprotein Pal [Dongiaceae bacterium]|nr:peptidoglycan-associated lipoprotein Pal [Dongiaceae bacterium]